MHWRRFGRERLLRAVGDDTRDLTSFAARRHCAPVSVFPRFTCLLFAFRLILILAGVVTSVQGEPFAAQLAIRHWQMEDGLPQNSANRVLQTHDGYIWVATYAGLARFDGRRFTTFGRESVPRLSTDRITALFEDAQHVLWIGCETGELFRYRGGNFESQFMGKSWTPTKIAWISSDERGEVWVLDRNGAMVRVRDGLVLPPPVTGDPARITNGLVKDHRDGRLWALRTGMTGLVRDGGWQSVELPAAVTGAPVQAIGAANDGGIWAAVGGKLFRQDSSQWSEPYDAGPWTGRTINSICEWEDGALAFGTLEEGLFLFRPDQQVAQIGRGQRLGDNWIQSLSVDQEGSLWVGTAVAGLSVLQRTNYERVRPPESQGVHPLKTVAVRKNGGIWIGSEGGGVYRLVDGQWTAFGRDEGLSNLYVWSILEDRSDTVWVGTWGGGIFELRDGKFQRLPGLEDPREQVAALYEARDGAMWIGTIHGLVRYSKGDVSRFGVAQGLAKPEVRSIAEDGSGGIWFGLAGGGLGSLRDGKIRLYGEVDGLMADYIVSLFFDDSGALWIGSTSGGLTRFKNGKFVQVGRKQGFPGASIGHISTDRAGNFWLSSDRGVFRIDGATLNACADGTLARITYERFGGGEGMERIENASGSQPAGCVTADGLRWYPAGQSLVRLNPKRHDRSLVEPAVLLEEFAVDGRVMAGGGEAGLSPEIAEIPPGHERFEFRFTAPTFVRPDRIRLRYRLTGLDGEWIDAGAERIAIYHQLPPGNYRFEVTAADGERPVAARTVGIAFTVQPRFLERWWVRLLIYLFAVLALAGGVVWQQRRMHHRETQELEREQAIERERTRIARDIHDDLGASLTRISLLSQSARRELDNPAQSAGRIDSIFATARELTHKMDEIVWAVNPRHDSLESVVDYFTNFAQELLGAAGIGCRLEMPLQLPANPVFAEARHHLFLGYREALHNIVKHSSATCATISLEASERELRLRVQDDGRGLVNGPSAGGGGNGLDNMRQRMAEVGGRCEVSAAPSGGTIVSFYLPLRHTPVSRENSRF
jgi:signal transduction histidine kinase/ligand-binding sensor domain-containing protein